MKKLHRLTTIVLFSALITSSLQGQDFNSEEPLTDYCQQDANCISAYSDGCKAAHWSSYATISAIIGAAIFFGIADKQNNDTSSSSRSSRSSSGHNSHGSCKVLTGPSGKSHAYSNH